MAAQTTAWTFLLLWAGTGSTGFSHASIAPGSDIVVFEKDVPISNRDGGDSSLVYGCQAGNQTGPCVDTKDLCTAQHGQFVGYCFFNKEYKGICCMGLDPATSSLTTSPPQSAPNIHDDPAPTSGPSWPQFPTMPTLPTAPTMPSMPTLPTGPTLPSAPTMPSLPTLPTGPTLPSAPTMPSLPTMPTLPTGPTLPSAPTMPSLPTMPTGPTLPSAPTMPSLPTMPTLPTGPTLPSAPTMPSLPTMPTGPTLPSAPTMPSLPTMPTGPTLPSAPTMPSLPTMPTLPTGPTLPSAPTMPSLPTMPTLPTGPTLPSAPTMPSLPTMPTLPTGPTLPSAPTMPSLPTMPTLPTGPTLPSAPTMPSLPTMPTLPTGPTLPSAPTMPSLPTMPTLPTGPTLPSAPTMPSLPTMPTLPTGPALPSAPSLPDTPSIPSIPANEPSDTSDEAPLPPPDPSCSIISTDIQSLFHNPSYPSLDTKPSVYQYTVVPHTDYCALRLEFLDALFASRNGESCSIDSVVIINSGDSQSVPQCGLLQGYRYTVRTVPEQPIRVVITTQSSAYLWNMNVTQIKCSAIRPYQDYEARSCGIKNAPKPPVSSGIVVPPEKETIKVVPASRLLKSKKRTLAEISIGPAGPTKLLQSVALNRKTEIKIVRGNETGINEWPWQVLLMINNRPLCGGSLLNDEWVITAAHCVQFSLRYPLVSTLTVDLGDHDLKSSTETNNLVVRVSKIVPNVKYEAVHNDIALIKLAVKVPLSKHIKPVCLPYPRNPVSTYEGETAKTTGWGRTEDSVISPVLREANLKVLSNEECRQQWSAVGEGGGNLIDNGMICADGGEVGPCNGDSGGPLVVQEYNKWRLIGVTSFGSLRGCAISGIPTVYTRVTSFIDWIALQIAE